VRGRVFLGVLGILVVAGGAFAAIGLGGSDDKVAPAPRVEREIERVSAAEARASGAAVQRARGGAKKVRISYFTASTPLPVPANGATDITFLTCPAGKAISGFYATDRLIAVDHFAAVPPAQWEFGFVDLAGAPGQAVEGIVCAKGVK
jgi:hypothetical protein